MGLRIRHYEPVEAGHGIGAVDVQSDELAEPIGEPATTTSPPETRKAECGSNDNLPSSALQQDVEVVSASTYSLGLSSIRVCTHDAEPVIIRVPPSNLNEPDFGERESVEKTWKDGLHDDDGPDNEMLREIRRLREQGRSQEVQSRSDREIRGPTLQHNPFADEANLPAPDVPGPEVYHRFYWNCMELKSELMRLDFSLRNIGSGGRGIQAANSVKLELRRLRDLYGTNTSWLFPQDVNVKIYLPNKTDPFLTRFASSFYDFGDALEELAEALYDFNTVYHDEKLMIQLFSLHSRFKAEASTVRSAYGINPRQLSEDMQFILDIWMDSAIVSLTHAIKNFHEKGVPAISDSQNNTSSGYLTLTTIAFFLSGTTASMLQVAADENQNVPGVAANTFLFSSLVFSVASAVSSLLVMGWHRSVVRVPDDSLPLWLKTGMRAGPMISLLIAGAFFAVALCLFVFASGQHTVTSAVTVVFSGIHVSGLLFLSGYFILQRWRFRQYAGAIGKDLTKDSVILSLIEWTCDLPQWLMRLHVRNRPPGSACAETGGELRDKGISTQDFGSFEESVEPDISQPVSPVIWHALSDEKFILNSMFIGSMTRRPSRPPILETEPFRNNCRTSSREEDRCCRRASHPGSPSCVRVIPGSPPRRRRFYSRSRSPRPRRSPAYPRDISPTPIIGLTPMNTISAPLFAGFVAAKGVPVPLGISCEAWQKDQARLSVRGGHRSQSQPLPEARSITKDPFMTPVTEVPSTKLGAIALWLEWKAEIASRASRLSERHTRDSHVRRGRSPTRRPLKDDANQRYSQSHPPPVLMGKTNGSFKTHKAKMISTMSEAIDLWLTWKAEPASRSPSSSRNIIRYIHASSATSDDMSVDAMSHDGSENVPSIVFDLLSMGEDGFKQVYGDDRLEAVKQRYGSDYIPVRAAVRGIRAYEEVMALHRSPSVERTSHHRKAAMEPVVSDTHVSPDHDEGVGYNGEADFTESAEVHTRPIRSPITTRSCSSTGRTRRTFWRQPTVAPTHLQENYLPPRMLLSSRIGSVTRDGAEVTPAWGPPDRIRPPTPFSPPSSYRLRRITTGIRAATSPPMDPFSEYRDLYYRSRPVPEARRREMPHLQTAIPESRTVQAAAMFLPNSSPSQPWRRHGYRHVA